jgi:hypothetical protein
MQTPPFIQSVEQPRRHCCRPCDSVVNPVDDHKSESTNTGEIKATPPDLKKISTKELVNELSLRVGVEREELRPYQIHSKLIQGPAIILIVTD